MIFEWDPEKAAANLKKHGVTFEEAATVFDDPLADTYDGPDHSEAEQRFLTFGFSRAGKPLTVAHCDRGSRVRIISARRMTRREKRQHDEATARERGELRREYDLTKLKGRVRAKHHKRATQGTNLVLLEPDVAKAFPDSAAVNEALRSLAKSTRRKTERARRPKAKGV